MDGHDHIDETKHVIVLGKFLNNKRYKEQIVRKIIAAICAKLNSNGGKVVIDFETDSNETTVGGFPLSQMSLVIRILEQSMISIIGLHQTISNIKFREDNESIIILVKKVDSLITINYNLYLPSQKQVVHASPSEPKKNVKDIINRQDIFEPVQTGSHCRTFYKDRICGFHESETIQFKHLEAQATKRTTLADRIVGKGNKFTCYVSAFANYSGGHLYFGITDDGIVAGELIPNVESCEIINKVEKAIKKMIWPERIGQPKRSEHWDICFEPILDENCNSIPSTFVIVIYIAACLGGVFTEEPECYEMVDEQVKKMSFVTWKDRMLSTDNNFDIPSAVQRVKWSSTTTESRCANAYGVLARAINNGKWELFSKTAHQLEYKYPEVEVWLVVLSQRVVASYRKGLTRTAKGWFAKYEERLPEAKDHLTFKVLFLCLKASLKRVEMEFEDSRRCLKDALFLAEFVPPGIVTAATLASAAMHGHSEPTEDGPSPGLLCIKVLEHLRYVSCYQLQAEMEQKAHISLAAFHLGYDVTGIMQKRTNESGLKIAKSSVMALHNSICNGFPVTRYREVQFNLVQSTLYYRYSQVRPEDKEIFLEEALHFSRKAQDLAKAFQSEEIVARANFIAGLCTERLLLSSLIKMNWVKKIYKSK